MRLRYVLLLIGVVMFAVVPGFGDHGGVQTTIVGYYLHDPVAIDGDLSDWPAGLSDNVVNQYLSSYTNPSSPADFTMTFKAYYNPLPAVNKLYVAVTVVDDDEQQTGPVGEEWLYDHPEMYIDGNHDHTGASTHPVDMQQYIFNLDHTSFVEGETPVQDPPQGCEWAFQKTGTTYTFEIALTVYDQYATVAHTLGSGQTIGFDMSWPDQDTDPNGDSWISWSPDGGKWNDSSLFGNMILGAMQDSEFTPTPTPTPAGFAAADNCWSIYE